MSSDGFDFSNNPLFDGEGFEAEHLGMLGAEQQRNRHHKGTSEQLSRIEELLKQQQLRGPACPHCGGKLPGTYAVCMHCKSAISWINGLPSVPGQEAKTLRTFNEEQNRQAAAKSHEERTKHERAELEIQRISNLKVFQFKIVVYCLYGVFLVTYFVNKDVLALYVVLALASVHVAIKLYSWYRNQKTAINNRILDERDSKIKTAMLTRINRDKNTCNHCGYTNLKSFVNCQGCGHDLSVSQ